MTRRGDPSAQHTVHKITIVALIAIGVMRIIATYPVLNHTIDEMVHIACGIEWWTNHTYCGIEQPPLARIAAGLGPYLDGLRVYTFQWDSVKHLFYAADDYFWKLRIARVGELPFFILAAGIVSAWTWRLHGPLASVLATLLLTALPPFLGYSGLAITDGAAAATFIALLYCLCRWLKTPDWKWTIWMGITAGAAVASKYSLLVFFGPAVAAVILLRWIGERRLRVGSGMLLAALSICILINWSTYSFSFGRLPDNPALVELPPPLSAVRYVWRAVPLPAPEMFVGICEVLRHDRAGHASFLAGEIRTHGWWYFFPLVVAVKTPIAFLLLWCVGLWFLATRIGMRDWEAWVPGACATGVLLAVMPSHLNLGVRHVLPIYPLMAVSAGAGAARLFERGRRPLRYAALVLLGWFLVASALAHPDYFPYFNEIAGREPERLRTDSDLDWGQDCERLGRRLKELGVNEPVGFAQFGTCRPAYHGIRATAPDEIRRRGGWLAVSVSSLTPAEVSMKDPDGRPAWAWLRKYAPVERIGRSILLFRVPPEGAGK